MISSTVLLSLFRAFRNFRFDIKGNELKNCSRYALKRKRFTSLGQKAKGAHKEDGIKERQLPFLLGVKDIRIILEEFRFGRLGEAGAANDGEGEVLHKGEEVENEVLARLADLRYQLLGLNPTKLINFLNSYDKIRV